MWKYWALVLCILVVVSSIEAGRRRNNKRRDRVPEGASMLGRWVHRVQHVTGEKRVSEMAYEFAEHRQVHVVSKDKPALKSAEMNGSRTIFDFSLEGESPVMVLKAKKRCYLMTVDEALIQEAVVKSNISQTNNTGHRSGASVVEYRVVELGDQVQTLRNRPGLCRLCGRKTPMRLEELPPQSSDPVAEGKVFRVSSLPNIISFVHPSGMGRQRNFRCVEGDDNNGRRNNGRRNNGRRRNNNRRRNRNRNRDRQ